MGWNRGRAALLAGAIALSWAAAALGPAHREEMRGPREPASSAEPSVQDAPRRAGPTSEASAPRAGARLDAVRLPLASGFSGGRSPWWLEPGPAVEVRIGAYVARATPARLDSTTLAEVMAGDRITLALPEVGPLDVVVQRVASPGPGVRQLQGHLADPAESYPVTFTLGPVLAFANVTTPTGSWIAEFENGTGWVLYDDLSDRLVDHRNSDARVPPRGEAAG